jgi:hypothetical protein
MPQDTRESRIDGLLLPAGRQQEAREGLLAEPTFWLSAGASLLLWTALALLLTSA